MGLHAVHEPVDGARRKLGHAPTGQQGMPDRVFQRSNFGSIGAAFGTSIQVRLQGFLLRRLQPAVGCGLDPGTRLGMIYGFHCRAPFFSV